MINYATTPLISFLVLLSHFLIDLVGGNIADVYGPPPNRSKIYQNNPEKRQKILVG